MERRRELTRRLATAAEDERRRVSRDLHDSLGQLQAGLGLAVAAARRTPGLPVAAGERLAEAGRLVDELARETHALAVRLRPTALDDFGLAAALAQLAADWSARTGLPVGLQTDGLGAGRLAAEVETAVYRLVQEALTNVQKHARASWVGVSVTRPAGRVTVTVEDDGVGFDPSGVVPGRLGLLGMKERVDQAGGTLQVESVPGGGTTLLARFALGGERENAHDQTADRAGG
jgi:signal transduction histidine kinase